MNAVVGDGDGGGAVAGGEQIDPDLPGAGVTRGVADGFADDADQMAGGFDVEFREGGVDGEIAGEIERPFKLGDGGLERLFEGEVDEVRTGEEVREVARAFCRLAELGGVGDQLRRGAGRGGRDEFIGGAAEADEILAERVVKNVAEPGLFLLAGAECGGGGLFPVAGAHVEHLAKLRLGAFA